MSRYSSYLGRAVEVMYRAGDICLPASGMFVGDSGRSIFLEQHFEQHGQLKNFRWEIPYSCIVRLEESETFAASAPETIALLENSAAFHEEAPVSPDHKHATVPASSEVEVSSQPVLATRAKSA
ncbi:MAG TPA: hypothetical protein VGF20_06355 [Candidatus Acidoferrum sp.]|jgi:hypothetical protein